MNLHKAAELLKQGKVVAFPTETVYGLGAGIFFAEAVQEIFRLKGRPADNPLIAHISDLAQLDQIVVEIPKSFYRLAESFFPGPLTIVLKKASIVPDCVTAGLPTLGVRMPGSSLARELIRAVGMPLVAPSANLSGKPSSTTAEHVRADFKDQLAAIVEGECRYGLESTVMMLEPIPTLLRPGQIRKEEIEQVLGCELAIAQESKRPLCPGMKYRHYAPNAPLRLFTEKKMMEEHLQKNPSCLRHVFVAHPTSLYAQLRKADQLGVEEIVVLYDANDAALKNRLLKASH